MTLRQGKQLLLRAGDIETNPGPTGRRSVAQGPNLEEQVFNLNTQVTEITQTIETLKINAKEAQDQSDGKLESLGNKIDETLSESINILRNDYEKKVSDVQSSLVQFQRESIQESEQRMESLLVEKMGLVNNNLMEQMSKIYHSSASREDAILKKIGDLEENIKNINENFESLTMQLEDVQEKMYDFEQNKKNNLIFYGVPGDGKETKDNLKLKIMNLLKLRLNIRREIPLLRASRMLTGPRVHGCRPALVTFETFKDREDVLKNSKALGRSQVTVTEDLSKRTRESRQELRKFMRNIKKRTPERHCVLEYDKLFIDHKVYVWNEVIGQVVEMSDSEKMVDPVMRTASAMSRGRPLSKAFSLSTPNVAGLMDSDTEILDRIRDLEEQIAMQQETIRSQQRQITEFGVVKDVGYESATMSNSNSAASSAGPSMANLSLSVSINGEADGKQPDYN